MNNKNVTDQRIVLNYQVLLLNEIQKFCQKHVYSSQEVINFNKLHDRFTLQLQNYYDHYQSLGLEVIPIRFVSKIEFQDQATSVTVL